MSPQFKHWLEKAQVQATAVVAFTVMWFLGWPVVRPWDPQGALAFIPTGDWGALAVFAALVLALAVCCAVATLSTRQAGALLAVLVGVAGLALHAKPMRALLWRAEDSAAGVFAALALEAVLMGIVLGAAAIVIAIVRGIFRITVPKWVWSEPPEEDMSATKAEKDEALQKRGLLGLLMASLRPAKVKARHVLACLLMELAVATIMLVITFRSTDRGQIAFALVASFFVSALVAHQAFPVRASAACWLGPIIMAVIVFLIGAVAAGSPDPPIWHSALMVPEKLPLRAALPVDWLALGGAGAVGGFWLSRRLHHARLHHRQEKAQK